MTFFWSAFLHLDLTHDRFLLLARLLLASPHPGCTRCSRNGTGFCETSEALFMNSGYVYETGEALESFDGTRDRFVYSRFRNPTVAMFEERLALIEGAAAGPRPAAWPPFMQPW